MNEPTYEYRLVVKGLEWLVSEDRRWVVDRQGEYGGAIQRRRLSAWEDDPEDYPDA